MTPDEYNAKYGEIQNWYNDQRKKFKGTNDQFTGRVAADFEQDYRQKINDLTNAYHGGSQFQKTPTKQSQGYSMPNFNELNAQFDAQLQQALQKNQAFAEAQKQLEDWKKQKLGTLWQLQQRLPGGGGIGNLTNVGQGVQDAFTKNANALTQLQWDIANRPMQQQQMPQGMGGMPQGPQQTQLSPEQLQSLQQMRQSGAMNPMYGQQMGGMGGMGGYGMNPMMMGGMGGYGGMMNPYAMNMFGPMGGMMNPMMMGGYGMMNPMMGMRRRRQAPPQQGQ